MRGLGCLILALALSSASATARADAPSSTDDGRVIGVTGVVLLGAGGIGVAVANGVIAGRHQRPRAALLVAGYVLAAANLVSGALGVGLWPGDPWALAAGGSMLAVGAADLGVTIWAHTRPAPPPVVSILPLVPLAGAVRSAGAFGGVGLRVAF